MARTTAYEWAKRVERWKDSGLSAKEFAAETGFKASALTYWRWKLRAAAQRLDASDVMASELVSPSPRRTSDQARTQAQASSTTTSPTLMELPVATVAISTTMFEVVLGDVCVRVSADFDEATLTRVVRAVSAAR